MSELNPEIINKINDSLKEYEVFNNIVRDSELQKHACEKLAELAEQIDKMKEKAVLDEEENVANQLLGFECVTGFLKSEITMWLLLKADQPDEAWRYLVDAQRAAGDAVRAHPGFSHLRQHVDRLHTIEMLVFPPQVFTSMGIIVRHRKCSICEEEYGECAHLVGKPYQGKICHTIVTELEKVDHVAIVSEPANKMCRVISFNVPGGIRNRMTWKIESEPESKAVVQQTSPEITARAIIYGSGEDFE